MNHRSVISCAAGAAVGAYTACLYIRDNKQQQGRSVPLASRFLPVAFNSASMPSQPRQHTDKATVGEFATSGIVFKDKVIVDAYPDPCVNGVTIYVSTVKDSRMKLKMLFVDPASSSVAVVQTGPISFKEPIKRGKGGEDVLSESKNLAFKSMRVRRIYDETTNCLVYVSYSTKLTSTSDELMKSDRYKTSVAVVPLGDTPVPNA